jgi:hypothetical protein
MKKRSSKTFQWWVGTVDATMQKGDNNLGTMFLQG